MQRPNNEDIKHVIYISRPTHFDHLVLENILSTSRSNNPKKLGTGNLIITLTCLQMLEGLQESVDKLYETILSDYRHADIVKLRDSHSNRRLYASWAMKNDSHQSWMLSRAEIAKMSANEALQLFDRLARENDQFLQ